MLEPIVIKTGSSANSVDGKTNLKFIYKLAEELQRVQNPILVVSGAIALGRSGLGFKRKPAKTEDLQLCAGYGQPILMEAYRSMLNLYNLKCSQILLTRTDIDHPKRGLRVRWLLEHHLENGVIPVINYNDATDTEELRTDNDDLALAIASDVRAKRMVFLTDADGLMKGDKVVSELKDPLKYLHLCRGKNAHGTGGMESKLRNAAAAQQKGITTHIGNYRHPLQDILEGSAGTVIRPI